MKGSGSPSEGVTFANGNRKVSLTTELRKILEEPECEGSTITNAQLLMQRLLEVANDGDVRAIVEVMNRIDGKVPDRLHHAPDAMSQFTDDQLRELAAE
jgi:hypothetical protein